MPNGPARAFDFAAPPNESPLSPSAKQATGSPVSHPLRVKSSCDAHGESRLPDGLRARARDTPPHRLDSRDIRRVAEDPLCLAFPPGRWPPTTPPGPAGTHSPSPFPGRLDKMAGKVRNGHKRPYRARLNLLYSGKIALPADIWPRIHQHGFGIILLTKAAVHGCHGLGKGSTPRWHPAKRHRSAKDHLHAF